jgi:hypothetical protein
MGYYVNTTGKLLIGAAVASLGAALFKKLQESDFDPGDLGITGDLHERLQMDASADFHDSFDHKLHRAGVEGLDARAALWKYYRSRR